MLAMLLVGSILPPFQFILTQNKQLVTLLHSSKVMTSMNQSCCWSAKSTKGDIAFKNSINWNYSYTKKNESNMLFRIIQDSSIISPWLHQLNKIFRSA